MDDQLLEADVSAQKRRCLSVMKAEPQKEHDWLLNFVGEWTYEGECSMGPDQPPMKSGGSETVRALGSLWVVGDGKSKMPDGSPATTMITLGFDPRTGRFVGTWVGSMMTHLWTYDGALDEAGRVLTLDSVGPAFAGDGTRSKYQDIFTMQSRDHRILTSRAMGPDGQWNEFMTVHYRRKK
jgi:hypothetical protein